MSVEHIQNSVNGVIAYLKENPKDALSTSPPITAVMEEGLRCRATGDKGQSIVTDMPEARGWGWLCALTGLAITRSAGNL